MKQETTPKLRFPEFTGDWEKKKLREVGKIVTGLTYSPKDKNENGTLVLRSSNVQNGSLVFNDNVYVKVDKFNPVLENDILICVRNGSKRLIGKNALIPKYISGVAFGAFMTVFRSNANIFISQLFSTDRYYRTIHKNLGARINSINNSELKKFDFFFPIEIKEQQKIAEFLTAVDKRIQTLEKKKSLLEDYKKGVMQKIFNQEIRFKDNNGNDYPDWEKKRLGDVATFYSGGTPRSSNKAFYNGNIPFIGSGNISDSSVESFITQTALESSSAKMVKKGDLLYALYGATSGEVAISQIDGAINQAVLCIRTTEDKFYLFQFLKYNKDRIVNTFIQGGQGNLSAKIVKQLKINLPCKAEQKKIANFLSAIDQKIKAVEEKLTHTQAYKKGLLQRMFV